MVTVIQERQYNARYGIGDSDSDTRTTYNARFGDR